jgi:hypothetical protein
VTSGLAPQHTSRLHEPAPVSRDSWPEATLGLRGRPHRTRWSFVSVRSSWPGGRSSRSWPRRGTGGSASRVCVPGWRRPTGTRAGGKVRPARSARSWWRYAATSGAGGEERDLARGRGVLRSGERPPKMIYPVVAELAADASRWLWRAGCWACRGRGTRVAPPRAQPSVGDGPGADSHEPRHPSDVPGSGSCKTPSATAPPPPDTAPRCVAGSGPGR